MQRRQDCIWLLLGARGGDNAQIRAIAAQLELPQIEKQLTYNGFHMLPNLAKGASLLSLRPQARLHIKPPWPRLVIAVGKRSVPIARYIKEQSGGSCRLVHLGRPRANLGHFDLVLTTPQYGLLLDAHVLELPVPPSGLINLDKAAAIGAQSHFSADKTRPFVVVVAGGNSTTAAFSKMAAQNLIRLAQQYVKDVGGSLFVLTSPRTPGAVVDVLQNHVKYPAQLIAWKQSDKDQVNPYAGLLALADEIVVTSDSASMIADGLAMGKPVKIFQLPAGWQGHIFAGISAVFARLDTLATGGGRTFRFFFAPWRGLRTCGLINPPRHMKRLTNRLYEKELAQPFPATNCGPDKILENHNPLVSFDQAITRIKILLSD